MCRQSKYNIVGFLCVESGGWIATELRNATYVCHPSVQTGVARGARGGALLQTQSVSKDGATVFCTREASFPFDTQMVLSYKPIPIQISNNLFFINIVIYRSL